MIPKRAILLVLDGVGIGEAHDAAAYGDAGSDTLGNLSRAVGGLQLPHLESLGLGCIAPLQGIRQASKPRAAFGCLQPASAGKDSTTGHWELCGVHLERPFPVYPNGFPPDVIDRFASATGRGVVGNIPASGTAIIERYAHEQRRSGSWIVYTSADSVFQIAADEHCIPLPELYRACEVARAQLVAPHNVSRVIARPFVSEGRGSYRRTANRRDYSVAPTAETLLDDLARAGVARQGVGKVDDLFARRNILAQHTQNNDEGIAAIMSFVRGAESGLCFANLVDFDQQYGHRNDTAGFYGALRGFDRAIPTLVDALREEDLLIITADHGNDPTTPSTDHSRERVPLLIAGPRINPCALGERPTFSDVGATIADWFRVPYTGRGRSFLGEVTA